MLVITCSLTRRPSRKLNEPNETAFAVGARTRGWSLQSRQFASVQVEGSAGQLCARDAMRLSPVDPLRYAMMASEGFMQATLGDEIGGAAMVDQAALEPRAHVLIAVMLPSARSGPEIPKGPPIGQRTSRRADPTRPAEPSSGRSRSRTTSWLRESLTRCARWGLASVCFGRKADTTMGCSLQSKAAARAPQTATWSLARADHRASKTQTVGKAHRCRPTSVVSLSAHAPDRPQPCRRAYCPSHCLLEATPVSPRDQRASRFADSPL